MGLRIGIVEDNAVISEMLQAALQLSGNEVVIYSNAQECINALISAHWQNEKLHDIVLTDLDLGQSIDGAEMIRRVRQFIPAEELAFLMMSGHDLVEQNLLKQNLLDIRVLLKPIKPSELLKELKREVAKK